MYVCVCTHVQEFMRVIMSTSAHVTARDQHQVSQFLSPLSLFVEKKKTLPELGIGLADHRAQQSY